MKYRCLVLDHDDTVVNSTACVHYPAFLAYLDLHFPGKSANYDLNDYFRKNSEPGLISLLRDEIGMSEEQMKDEEIFWGKFVEAHTPAAYDGIREILADFRAEGGLIAVDSHSYVRYIERDYRANGLPMPDVIFGWDLPPEQRKPSPFTLHEICRTFDLKPSELLVVDDSRPGCDMAKAAGCPMAAAGWAFDVPEIEAYMRANSRYYCKSVEKLREILGLKR